jgi:anti-sigma factor RsiW
MDCPLIEGNLVGYHLAALEEDDRSAVEAHLLGCGSCLRTYLALKTQMDRGGRDASGPSEQARLRLRAAVQERFRPVPSRRLVRWLRRPVPLYQGVAVVAVAIAAAALLPTLARVLDRADAERSAERVDTARPVAQSRTIY